MPTLEGTLWTPAGWLPGRLVFDSRITRLERVAHAPERYILPGFIDVHVHGGGGADAMDGESGIRALARFHARHGTTSLLPTTITTPWPQVMAALTAIRSVRDAPQPEEAAVLGAHLEGPFVSPQRLGAQPPFAVLPTPQRVAEVLALDTVRVVTLAPELPGALEAARAFARAGVRVSLGHTVGTAEQAAEVIGVVLGAGGEVGGTHLFNAMSGLSGREPGVVGALLAEPAAYAELILDGHHVHRASFLAALQAKPERLLLITDAMRAAGMPDGEYDLGGQSVQVQNNQARLPGGTLAGSLLTLNEALRQATRAGTELHLAVALLSQHPARYLGLSDRGELRPGLRADVVVLSSDLSVQQVFVAGVQTARNG
ncbi:N-acetylglucosamine-6-phosphate deacetylase [Deinococcus sp.]|uniref:N-acetylglucosamine-6-phosphate deacetylase n=1 Tax=Deinococcus sp. TaxID=47478 RepID=UPI003C7D42DA